MQVHTGFLLEAVGCGPTAFQDNGLSV